MLQEKEIGESDLDFRVKKAFSVELILDLRADG